MKPLDVIAGHFSPCLGRLRGEECPVSRSWTRARRVRGCALNEIAVELGSNWHTINVVLGNLPAHMATAVSD